MNLMLRYTMTVGAVASVLNLSSDRVRQLDDKLRPIVLSNGHRRYDAERVKAYRDARLARKAGAL